MPGSAFHLRTVQAISDIAKSDWNACARSDAAAALPENPFVSHDFLERLELSGAATERTGWTPHHLAAYRDDRLVGVAPCYLKWHPRGEYVFDHGWAEAYARAGGRYYPKLQVAVPFTPATGPRLMARTDEPDAERVRSNLADGLVEQCANTEASSVHVTFAPENDWDLLRQHGYLARTDIQFHWENHGYASFEDFLAALSSRYRKAVRRERREALQAGITIHWLTGEAITEAALDAFFAFYIETGSRKWVRPYLNRAFYSLVTDRMRDRIVLIMAKRDGRWIAGAINFLGKDTLFGRHWGAVEHHPFLHFEVCYYQAIEFAIAHRLKWVEAGAQGEHKVARGYLPVTTRSAHYIADPMLRRAVRDYLVRERAYMDTLSSDLAASGPFRRDGGDPAGPS